MDMDWKQYPQNFYSTVLLQLLRKTFPVLLSSDYSLTINLPGGQFHDVSDPQIIS